VSEEKIQIKGISEGLLVTLREDRWKDAQELIISRIDQKAEFFQGAKIAVDVGEISLKAADLGKLRDELSTRGISLWAVLSRSETTISTAQILGLSTDLGVNQNIQKQKKGSTVFEGDSAVWVEKTLRAGYKVETKCHVVVMGDVNPGAEIISAGNILVWGRLSGSVHAGADGDQGAKVMALNMVPTGLQIADRVAQMSAKKRKKQPEVAYIFENEIIIDGWDTQKNHRGDL
jgi:septum site-determining protein MinC